MSSILDKPAIRQAALPITVEQYHQLGEAGIIAENTELIRGVILEKTIKSPQHTWIVQSLADQLREHVGDSCHLRQEQPLTLQDSEPEPDIAVVPGKVVDYRHAHPATAVLLIEVAVSSEDVDREKADLYASAGVEEYWLVLPQTRLVEVFTNASDSGYAITQQFSVGDTISPQGFPAVAIDLGRLFA